MAKPTNATLMKQFCRPKESIQGVMAYPMAKLMVLRTMMMEVRASPEMPWKESTRYEMARVMPQVEQMARHIMAKTRPNQWI